MLDHSKVILPHVHIMRSYDDEDRKIDVVSGVLLPHLIENLILSGALEVLITDSWRYSNEFYNELEKLPQSAKRYIRTVDSRKRTQPIADELFEPILEEFGIRYGGSAYHILRDASSDEEALAREAALTAHAEFPRFLEALFLKAHFHFDIGEFLLCLQVVRHQSKDMETRVKISGIEAILSTYQPFDLSSALVVPSASKAHADRLMEIVLSTEYSALSNEHSALGRLTNIPHVVAQIDLRVRNLLDKIGIKETLRYTSKAATAATGVPVPTTDLAEKLVSDSFLPPTLDMSEIILRAKRELISSDPEIDKKRFRGL